MRTRLATVLACFLALGGALFAAGCGGRAEPETPVACLEGTGAYLSALRAAPAAVRLADGTPIGDCLADNQQAGDLATVGEAMVEAATRLNAEARAEAGGKTGVELGYLVGAAAAAAEKTEGVHAQLVRRLAVAARFAPDRRPLSPAFLAAYKRGYDAGHATG
jgi:hypothetical protein